MFIKLTRLDNSPIWINASFVVTVEPRKGGGAVVVPIGDGLDYDVRESPQAVLAMLGEAPAPAVVPVPPPKGLTKTPDDVSPDPEPVRPEPPVRPVEKPVGQPQPVIEKPAEESPAAAPAEEAEPIPPAEPSIAVSPAPAEEASAAKPARKTAARKPRAPRKTAAKKAAPAELSLSDEQVERLRKMAPGSVRKLQNTLASQFGDAAPETTVQALESRGVLALDRDHVIWK